MSTKIKTPALENRSRLVCLAAGGALWLLSFVVVGVTVLTLQGCAGVSQAVQAYGSVAVTDARAANDTVIEAQKVGFCGLPLSAITRHPEIIPAVRSLCLTPEDKNGAALLDAVAK